MKKKFGEKVLADRELIVRLGSSTAFVEFLIDSEGKVFLKSGDERYIGFGSELIDGMVKKYLALRRSYPWSVNIDRRAVHAKTPDKPTGKCKGCPYTCPRDLILQDIDYNDDRIKTLRKAVRSILKKK